MTTPDPTPTHSHHGVSLGVLTKKVGPLPGWAWVGLMVAGYFVYKHFYAKPASSTLSGDGTTAPTDSGPSNSSGSGWQENTLPGPGNGVHTNREWARQAELLLAPQHHWTPGAISTALSRYLARKGLTPQEVAIVNAAIAIEGPPPGGVLPIIKGPTPKPPHHPHTPKPPHPHTYITHRGDTWPSIAHHFYGNGNAIPFLMSANPHVKEPIKPGTRIILPDFISKGH